MKSKTFLYGLLAVVALVALGSLVPSSAVETWTQTLSNDVSAGVATKGAGILQFGQIGTLTSAVASNTRAEVVAAPSAGSTYVQAIWIEKATNSSGYATVTYGTGANCVTSPTVILTLGPATATSQLRIGYYPVNVLLPATKALCLTTDGAGTSARAIAN